MDFSKMTWAGDFRPRNPKLVLQAGSKVIISFESTFMGREYFCIRDIYDRYGEWAPGKGGIQVPLERKQDLLDGLSALMVTA